MDSCVVLIPAGASSMELISCIRSLVAAGVGRIMVVDPPGAGSFPVVDPREEVFMTEDALLGAVSSMDGFVYVSECFQAPPDFVSVMFGRAEPGTVVGTAGFLMSEDGKTARWYYRQPNGVRFARNDDGDVQVDGFCRSGYLVEASAVGRLSSEGFLRAFGSTRAANAAFSSAGMRMMVADTPWGRPVLSSGDNVARVPAGLAASTLPSASGTIGAASGATAVVNDLQYPGRLGNLLLLMLSTAMDAVDAGVPLERVFFRRRVDTYDGWADRRGRLGRKLVDYMSENRDILVPTWGNMLSNEEFERVRSSPGTINVGHRLNTPIIREFTRRASDARYSGVASSLFYDEKTFERHRSLFPQYYGIGAAALHVRRTDFQYIKDVRHATADDIQRLADGLAGRTVVVFSDDIEWCRRTLRPPRGGRMLFHPPGERPCDDMILMSCFGTVVQSAVTSTYSLVARLLSEDLRRTGRMSWEPSARAAAMRRRPSVSVVTYARPGDLSAASRFVLEQASLLPFPVSETRVVECGSREEFNDRFVKRACDDFGSDFVLLVESDASVANPSAWSDEFLEYDYVGAPWTTGMKWHRSLARTLNEREEDVLVGNSGFSLRSRRFCEACRSLGASYDSGKDGNCDTYVCMKMAAGLRGMGIRFAPVGVAERFSVENGRAYGGQFGVHKSFTVDGRLIDLSRNRFTTIASKEGPSFP